MFWEELVKLTTQTSWIVIILLVVGIISCFVEAIVPGFGFFGIFGIICEIGGIVLHAVFSGSIIQVFIIVMILALIFTLLFLIFIRSAKYGLIGKSALVENKTAIPTDYADVSKNENVDLIGKHGILITECKPVGKMRIDDKIFDVLSNEVIEAGNNVVVTGVENNVIYIALDGGIKWVYY